jgi:hypothetical protein
MTLLEAMAGMLNGSSQTGPPLYISRFVWPTLSRTPRLQATRGTIFRAWEPKLYIYGRAGESVELFPSLTTMASENVPPPVIGRRGREGALQVGARKKP